MYMIVTKSKNYVKVWHTAYTLLTAIEYKKRIKKANNYTNISIIKIK